jgi:hypothetical protein
MHVVHTSENVNAVEGPAKETIDTCGGHPNIHGAYHYHEIPGSCLYNGILGILMV